MYRNRHRIVGVLAAALGLALSAAAQGPNKWAVIVGISEFKNFKKEQQLEFAHRDAEALAKFIKSERGRAFPEDNVKLLINADATYPAVRTAMGAWLAKRAKTEDIVYVFIATHGMVEKDAAKQAFLVTHDADPEDLFSTSLQMEELTGIIGTRLAKAGRIVLLTDACRAGKLGESQRNINRYIENGAIKNQELLGLLASRPGEFSQEGAHFGGGHGAFSYLLLKGLNGEADGNKDNTVTVIEIINYLQKSVPAATNDQQHIREIGNIDNEVPLAYPDKPGASLGFSFRWPFQRFIELLASQQAVFGSAGEAALAMDRAIKEGRLLTPPANSAWDYYQQVARSNAQELVKDDLRDTLAVALENEGQRILRDYLRGDATPLTGQQYRYGSDLFSRASELSPEVPSLKAKARFCQGRALFFENRFRDAEVALRESIGIEPDGAYSYNALGITYFALRRYDEAVKQLSTAAELAAKWAYPLYNLGLTYTAMGRDRFADAEKAYRAALERGPNYTYIRVNLGNLYMQMRRERDAEREFREAIKIRPDEPFAHNMLGQLLHNRGDLSAAEASLRAAVKAAPQRPDVHKNLALVLIERNQKDEAEKVLREAVGLGLQDPGLHMQLGDLLFERDKLEDAEAEFTMILMVHPNDPSALERLGDTQDKLKRYADAAATYKKAFDAAPDPVSKTKIERKLRAVEKKK